MDASHEACELFEDPPPRTRPRPRVRLLVERGDCFFLEKAWHAQLAGAAAVLVVDNVEEDLLTMANPTAGQGGAAAAELASRIDIPSALVRKSVGEELRTFLAEQAKKPKPAPIIVTQDFPRPSPTRTRASSGSSGRAPTRHAAPCDHSMRFVSEMKPAAQTLERQNATAFTPHFLTWSCADSGDRAARTCA